MDSVNIQEDFVPKSGNLMESKTTLLDDILHEKLENAFHKKTSQVMLHEIAKIAIEHSPIDLAYAVSHLPYHTRPILYDNLPNSEAKIKFIVNTSNDTRLIIFRYMNEREMKILFDKMPTDEAVWVLEDMSERRFRRVMELIDQKKATKIKELKKHHRNSAGRLMTSTFLVFDMDKTIGQAAEYIHDFPRIDFSKGIFVTNENDELEGYVPSRNMIVNSQNVPLKQVMRPILHKVSPESTREEVIDIFERYKVSFLPVVENEKIVGVIAHEDVIEAMEDLADEAFAMIAGTAEKVSPTESIFKRFFARSPWLIVTLIAGLINVGIMSSFEKKEGLLLTFVLFFVPLITGMSGNIGIQCSTVLVRSMAVGLISVKNKWDAIRKELLVGLFAGLVFGLGCGVIVYLIDTFINIGFGISPVTLGVIVGSGLIGACLAGTFLGVFSPIFFAWVGIDPAISSGPIVTAFNDILSMSIYFLISYTLGMFLIA